MREIEIYEFDCANLEPDPESGTDEGRVRIVELLGPSPLAIDDLVRLSRLTPATVLTILLELEIAGRVQRHPGNQVSVF